MKMTYDEAGLPAYAYAKEPLHQHHRPHRARGAHPVRCGGARDCRTTLNERGGRHPRPGRRHVRRGDVRMGHARLADPKNYNEAGAYIGPEMEDKHGEE